MVPKVQGVIGLGLGLRLGFKVKVSIRVRVWIVTHLISVLTRSFAVVGERN